MPQPPDIEPSTAVGTDDSAFPRVDALFAGEPPPPPLEASVRLRRLQLLLGLGIPLNILAIPCCSGVPGAVLTLWAYVLADGENARIQAGQYSSEDAARLVRLQSISTWTLYYCVVSFLIQVWLLSTVPYLGYLSWCIEQLISAMARLWTLV